MNWASPHDMSRTCFANLGNSERICFLLILLIDLIQVVKCLRQELDLRRLDLSLNSQCWMSRVGSGSGRFWSSKSSSSSGMRLHSQKVLGRQLTAGSPAAAAELELWRAIQRSKG